ncbi:MAG: hypothetical protein D6681_13000 [Calditrichaeota bacterium]|nr:MAG: hypothetical protein D6681_13000 [Calditrichota bacterium]
MCASPSPEAVPFIGHTRVLFADRRQGQKLLTTRDDFLARLSRYDQAVRLLSRTPVSEPEFLHHLAANVLEWQPEDRQRFTLLIEEIREKLSPFHLSLPDTIWLIKTTAREEGNTPVAYTRMNAIILSHPLLNTPDSHLRNTLIHELFHILSRHNPQLRDSLYALIGFHRCGEITLPPSLRERKLTNPDAPRLSHYIYVRYRGERIPVVPVTYIAADLDQVARGSGFFSFLEFRLLAVECAGDTCSPRLENGEPLLLPVSAVEGYFRQIGRNTDYIIHPEEILASNFVFLVTGQADLPSPNLLEKLRRLLTR